MNWWTILLLACLGYFLVDRICTCIENKATLECKAWVTEECKRISEQRKKEEGK